MKAFDLLLSGGAICLLGFKLCAADPGAVEPKIQFILDEASGKPGDAVKLQMSVVTNVKLASLSVAINFDEGKLHVDAAERKGYAIAQKSSVSRMSGSARRIPGRSG